MAVYPYHGNSGVLSLDVNPGQFGSSTESVVVTTSNYTGYSMTIAPSSGNNTDLEHTNVANTVIPSISESLTQSSFSSLNSVAYGLSIDDGANYLPVVSGSTIKTTSTATNATTGSFNLTLGAKTLANTPAGSYTKTFVLTATANPVSWAITYNKNTNDTVTNMPTSNEATVSGTTVTISSKTPTRDGYNFLGWAESSSATTASIQPTGTFTIDPTTTNTKTFYAVWQSTSITIIYDANTGSGSMPEATYKYEDVEAGDEIELLYASNFSKTGYGFAGFSFDQNAYAHLVDNDQTNDPIIYGPNETFEVPNGFAELADSNNKVRLYAVWVPAETDGNNHPIYLQNWSGCASMSDGEITALTDSRDGSVYAVARIEKNTGESDEYAQCWLMENLRLDISSANITAENTNNPTEKFLREAAAINAPQWEECTYTTCEWANFYDQISYNIGNVNGSGTASYNSTSMNSPWFSYGGNYNWYTATAGHGLYESTGSNFDTEGDICPAGWRVPSDTHYASEDIGDFSALDLALGGDGGEETWQEETNHWRIYPINLIYSGTAVGTSKEGRGTYGSYWSRTRGDTDVNGADSLSISSNSLIVTGGIDWSYKGETIRCLIGNTWGIHFEANANDASGTMLNQAIEPDTYANLKANAFYRPISGNSGYRFTGWNTQADGLGTSYTDEQSVYNLTTAGSTITLYAQWEQVNSYMTVNFNGNGLNFGNSITQNTLYYYNDSGSRVWINGEYKTPNVAFNQEFLGWDTNSSASYPHYDNASEIRDYLPGNNGDTITVYAIWEQLDTIHFDGNGATSGSMNDIAAPVNDYVVLPMNRFSIQNYTFVGWDEDPNAIEPSYSNEDIYYTSDEGPEDITLYAIWVPNVIIHFNGSGGTGTMADQGIASGASKNLEANGFSKSGYTFAGWATSEGSTNVEYTNRALYTAQTISGSNPVEVTLYAVWGRSRTIAYNKNGNDASGTMSNQTNVYEYQPTTLYASNFARPNYGFAGWSTDSDAYTHMTDNDQTNDPTIYGPNETIAVPGYGTGSSTFTLYAVWVPAESGVTMQTFSPSDSTYSSKPTGSVIALNDNRDTTNVYAVAKLQDGNWWMIENLRLDPAGKTLDSTNTNNPDSSFASTVSSLQSSSFANCTNTGATNGPTCMNQYSVGLGNINGSSSNRTSSSQSYRWYSYGAMYNWYTATAGHGTYSNTSSDGPMSGDICPAGWHLPYGGLGNGAKGGNTSGGFYYLNVRLYSNNSNGMDATASSNLRVYPNNFIYSGEYHGSTVGSRGSGGNLWTSTAESNNFGYYISLASSSVIPGTGLGNKYYGRAVRCIASPRQTLTLSFDSSKVASVEIDGTSYSTNGATISLVEGSTHTINMTFQIGYEFDSWGITGTGSSVASTSTNPTTLTMGTTSATLTANAIESEPDESDD